MIELDKQLVNFVNSRFDPEIYEVVECDINEWPHAQGSKISFTFIIRKRQVDQPTIVK